MTSLLALAPLHWADLGHAALLASLPVVGLSLILLIARLVTGQKALLTASRWAAVLSAAVLTVSIVGLGGAFFSEGAWDVIFVHATSDTTQSDSLQLASIWAGQNGSILFWCWILGVYLAALAVLRWKADTPKEPWMLLVANVILAFFIGSVLFLDQNPFDVEPTEALVSQQVPGITPPNTGEATVGTTLAWLGTPITNGPEGATRGSYAAPEAMAALQSAPPAATLASLGIDPRQLIGTTVENLHAAGYSVRQNGFGMNPLLANYWIVIHPPCMYTGYIGTAIIFAFVLGALISRETDRWVRELRPWMLWVWTFLTVGNILGGLWAYEELGWGGFWAWDPVENGAILPWFVATALLHSIMVQEKRGSLRVWNVGLAAGLFIATLIGTWITRSGMINSVHSFAMNTQIGYALLTAVGVTILVTVWLVAWRWHHLRHAPREIQTATGTTQQRPQRPVDRIGSTEFSILGGNIALLLLALVTIGLTIYPLIYWRTGGDRVSTTDLFFITAPLFLAMFFFMALGMAYSWRKLAGTDAEVRVVWPLALSVGVAVLAGLMQMTMLPDWSWSPLFANLEGGADGGAILRSLLMPMVPPLLIGIALFGLITAVLEFHLPVWRVANPRSKHRLATIVGAGTQAIALGIVGWCGAQIAMNITGGLPIPLGWQLGLPAGIGLGIAGRWVYGQRSKIDAQRAKIEGIGAPASSGDTATDSDDEANSAAIDADVKATAGTTPSAAVALNDARPGYGQALRRLVGTNRRRYGGYTVHLGALMLLVGVCIALEFKTQDGESFQDMRIGEAKTIQVGFPQKDSATYTLRRVEAGVHLERDHPLLQPYQTGAKGFRFAIKEASTIYGDPNAGEVTPEGDMPMSFYEAPGVLGAAGQGGSRRDILAQVRFLWPDLEQRVQERMAGLQGMDPAMQQQVLAQPQLRPDDTLARMHLAGNWGVYQAMEPSGDVRQVVDYTYSRSWLEFRLGQPAIELDVAPLIESEGQVARMLIVTEVGPFLQRVVGRLAGETPQQAFARITSSLRNSIGRLTLQVAGHGGDDAQSVAAQIPHPQLAPLAAELGTPHIELGISMLADESNFRIRLLPTGAVRSLSPAGVDRVRTAVGRAMDRAIESRSFFESNLEITFPQPVFDYVAAVRDRATGIPNAAVPSLADSPYGFLIIRPLEGPLAMYEPGDANPDGLVTVKPPDRIVTPTLRQYQTGSRQTTREVDVNRRLGADEHIVPDSYFSRQSVDGQILPNSPSTVSFTVHHNPAMTWNLIGCFLMLIGVLLAAWPTRIGSSQRTREAG